MGTARDLTITSWAREAGDSPFTVGVPGLKLTGWWVASPPPVGALEGLRTLWPQGVTINLELDILEDLDARKHQICAYVRIRRYPAHWLEVVGSSLKYFVEKGAAISWAGGWECFLQYSPAERFAGCYAAFTSETGLICSGDLDHSITYLDQIPGAQARLHSAVEALVCSEGGL
jgi:hypothetical protein